MTLATCGEGQMDTYAITLEFGRRWLKAQPRDEWDPGGRCYPVERHLILYEVIAREFSMGALICRVIYSYP